jgi:hypothetical protein
MVGTLVSISRVIGSNAKTRFQVNTERIIGMNGIREDGVIDTAVIVSSDIDTQTVKGDEVGCRRLCAANEIT